MSRETTDMLARAAWMNVTWWLRGALAFAVVWVLAPRRLSAHRFDIAWWALLAVVWVHIVAVVVDTVRLKWQVLRIEREIEAIKGARRE